VAAAHDVADADATDDVDDEQAAVIRFAWMQQQQQQQEQQQPYVAGQHLYATCGTATCVFQPVDECQCDDCFCCFLFVAPADGGASGKCLPPSAFVGVASSTLRRDLTPT